MSLIVALILGGIVGWLGARVMGRQEGVIGSVGIGIVGAVIGNALAYLLGGGTQGYLVFSWPNLLWALIGAIIFSAILNAFQHSSHHDRV
jgi:uncharacterized membrane protein YeaQ/YmgE (transglycosylase-associated protein family)